MPTYSISRQRDVPLSSLQSETPFRMPCNLRLAPVMSLCSANQGQKDMSYLVALLFPETLKSQGSFCHRLPLRLKCTCTFCTRFGFEFDQIYTHSYPIDFNHHLSTNALSLIPCPEFVHTYVRSFVSQHAHHHPPSRQNTAKMIVPPKGESCRQINGVKRRKNEREGTGKCLAVKLCCAVSMSVHAIPGRIEYPYP